MTRKRKYKERDSKITSKIMSKIRSKNTKPEKLLGSELYSLGLRYRKHYPIKGKPDFVFVSAKIAVFVDGDFWHGNNAKLRGLDSFEQDFKKNRDYWIPKIKRNIERDKEVTSTLKEEGWIVIRFWESEVKVDPKKYALKIKKIYSKRLSRLSFLQ